jgi:hypothetical protein
LKASPGESRAPVLAATPQSSASRLVIHAPKTPIHRYEKRRVRPGRGWDGETMCSGAEFGLDSRVTSQ